MKQIMKLMELRHEFYEKNPTLGATHLHLLEHLAICEAAGANLTVTEAMKIYVVASPATIHRHMEDLVDRGYLKKDVSPDSGRVKLLRLTKKSIAYFARLQKLMDKQ